MGAPKETPRSLQVGMFGALPAHAPQDSREVTRLVQAVRREIKQCEKCARHKHRHSVVLGEGATRSRPLLALIAGSPSTEDDRSGRPFSARTGELMDRAFKAAQLSRAEVWLDMALRCYQAPDIDEDDYARRRAEKGCMPYLARIVGDLIQPFVILAMGGEAGALLLGYDGELSVPRYRQRWWAWSPGGTQQDAKTVEYQEADKTHATPVVVTWSMHDLMPATGRNPRADLAREFLSDLTAAVTRARELKASAVAIGEAT